MTYAKSPGAYADCQTLFERAEADPVGARLRVPDLDAAIRFRARMHYARKLDREANAISYPDPADPRHNRSIFDKFVVTIRRSIDDYYVYVVRIAVNENLIENLSKAPPLIEYSTEAEIIEEPEQIEDASPKPLEPPMTRRA